MNAKPPMTYEEWIAAGNTPKVLPIGFTHFKDGVIPRAKGNHRTEEMRLEQEKKIAEKNQLIRQSKEARKLQKAQELEKLKQEKREQQQRIKAEQVQLLNEFYRRAGYGDLARLCRMAGITHRSIGGVRTGNWCMSADRWALIKEIIGNFEYNQRKAKDPAEKPQKPPREKPDQNNAVAAHPVRKKRQITEDGLRRRQVSIAKKTAIARGETTFQAPCAVHGMTLYMLKMGRAPRCYRCCMDAAIKRDHMHDDAIRQGRRERKLFNQERMKEAVAAGQVFFEGLCVNCGYTQFRACVSINKYKCETCRKAADEKYKRKMAERKS